MPPRFIVFFKVFISCLAGSEVVETFFQSFSQFWRGTWNLA